MRGENEGRTYLAIDLKSFYASVECVDRGLDPLTTNLVVADVSRTEKTICLAVSPSLKQYGIGGRARLFELFKRQTGLSPNDYLLRFRIRKAQELLVQTDLPVREIARRIGMPDSGYFSIMFKRQTGHTPTTYRERSQSGK